MLQISKSQFKPKALAIMRMVEKTGEGVIITDHGKPTLKLAVYKIKPEKDPFERLKGTVLEYHSPTKPVSEEDWEALS